MIGNRPLQYIVFFVLFTLSASSFSQQLLLKNTKGKVIKELLPGDYVSIQMNKGVNLEIPTKHIDTVYEYIRKKDYEGCACINRNMPFLQLKGFNAKIDDLLNDTAYFADFTYDTVQNSNLRNYSKRFYKIYFNEQATYPKVNIQDIRLMRVEPEWRQALLGIGSIAGIMTVVFSPIFTYDVDKNQPTWDRFIPAVSAGIAIWGTCTFHLWRIKNRVGYYSTNPEDKKALGKYYKTVTFEIKKPQIGN